MTIKNQALALKKRAQDLGYEIKLTHAQEMVAAMHGHQSRHSALLADKQTKNLEVTPEAVILKVPRKLPEEEFEMSKEVFFIGIRLGKEVGKKLKTQTEEIVAEFKGQISEKEILKARVFYQSLSHGILKGINSTLEFEPIFSYFKELSDSDHHKTSGKQHLPKIIKDNAQKFWDSLKKQS